MRTLIGFAAILIMAGALAAPPLAAEVEVDVEITFDVFHERLSPHGEWIEVEKHGWCWQPHGVHEEWRPYSDGHWVYADSYGWTWVSDHEWGWAPFHYGRWMHHSNHWVWVPGYEWSGAWVAWRHGGAHIGWAALPVEAEWEVGVGFRSGFSFETGIYEPSWVFVGEPHFTSVSLGTVLVSPGNTKLILGNTAVLGSVKFENSVVVNNVLTVTTVERAVGKPVKHMKIRTTRTLGAALIQGDENEVRMFKPRVRKSEVGSPKNVDRTKARLKTTEEKHEAEAEHLKARHEKEAGGKGDDSGLKARHEKERKELDERHQREREDIGKGQEQPGKGREDPSKGKEDPSKGKEDPSKGKEDPIKGKEDPSKGKEDPSKGKEDPSKGKEDPSKGKEDPNKGGGKGKK